MINFFLQNFIYIAVSHSILFSVFGIYMYLTKSQRSEGKITYGNWFFFKEFWHRLVSFLVGWYAIYLFIFAINEQVSFNEILLLTIGTLGIIGWLPYTLMEISKALAAAVARLIDKI